MDALTTHQLQVRGERVIEQSSVWPHHTTATGGEEREVIEPIKWMRSPHTSYRWRGERVIEPIKCMHSPHTSYRWRGEESHRANQVYALTTHQATGGGGERERS